MPTVMDSLGDRFERFLVRRFKGLHQAKDFLNGNSLPDLYNEEFRFGIEAKAGNITWGVRIKDYQVRDYGSYDVPIVYFLGMHNFHNARDRLEGLDEKYRRKILRKCIKYPEIYFFNQELIGKIWKMENTMNEKDTINYCMVKKSILKHILKNRTLERNGAGFIARDSYDYNPEEYLMQTEPVLIGRTNYRAALHLEKDKRVIEYLRGEGVLR
jgi:hypothetical protein